jgi:hypothetical protein
MKRLSPHELITTAEIRDERHFKRVVYVTMLGCFVLGFAIGFVTGFWLK